MEQSRYPRGGEVQFLVRAAAALGLTAVVATAVRLVAKNKRNPEQRGGWQPINFEDTDVTKIVSETDD